MRLIRGQFGVDVRSMCGGCIEEMQIKQRQQVYIYPYLLQLFIKSVRMFVRLIPSHKRFGKCHARQTRPTSYITNSGTELPSCF